MTAPSGAAAYVPLSGVIRLNSPLDADTPPQEVLERALAVGEALTDIAEPLALDLLLGCRAPGVPVLEHEPVPEHAVWQIVERGLPDALEVRAPEAQVVEASALSADALREWGARALAQPAGEYEVTLSSLRCSYSRSLVSDVPADATGYVLLDESGPIELPLERRDGATWVLAPAHDLLMQPPVSWAVSRDVEIIAELWVNWSPWLEPSRPEGAGVRRAVERLQASGWTLREPVFALGLTP